MTFHWGTKIERYRVKESRRAGMVILQIPPLCNATHRSGLDDLDPGSEAGVTMVRAG